MAPTVQSLDQILAGLEPAYGASRSLYNQQLSTVPQQGQAVIAGLDTAKQNSFRDINTGANSKGLAFSGVPIAEQSRYLGEKYLPAVAGVQADTQKQTFTLQQALASLEADKYKTGLSTQQDQQKVLTAYQEAERQRQFEAQQKEADRQNQLKAAAANRAPGPSAGDIRKADVGAASSFLQSVKGRDGKVSPDSWKQARDLWQSIGYSSAEFDKTFAGYRNPNNPYYEYGKG
jgi:hypothetical protein